MEASTALVVAVGGYVLWRMFGEREVSADPSPPLVPVSEDGQVVAPDGSTASSPSSSGGKAKIPQPKMPADYKRVPRFVEKGGLTYWNDAYRYSLRDVLKAYRVTMYTPGGGKARYQLQPLGTVGPATFSALAVVASAHSRGATVFAARTLLEGQAGQEWALLWELPSVGQADAAMKAEFAILPKLPK